MANERRSGQIDYNNDRKDYDDDLSDYKTIKSTRH